MLGVSLSEQAQTSARDLSEILAVDDVFLRHEADQREKANHG